MDAPQQSRQPGCLSSGYFEDVLGWSLEVAPIWRGGSGSAPHARA
jgi:hypothetical protein